MFFVKIRKWGNSDTITLPKLLKQMLRLSAGDFLYIDIEQDGSMKMKKAIMTTAGLPQTHRKRKEKKYANDEKHSNKDK